MRFFSLNIRQKISLGFLLCAAVIGGLGTFSYLNLLELEKKIQVIESADDLRNLILDIRRFEKNFLLYNDPEALADNRRLSREALAQLEAVEVLAEQLQGGDKLEALRRNLAAYDAAMQAMSESGSVSDAPSRKRDIEGLRAVGQHLIEQSQILVAYERGKILTINNNLKQFLFLSMILLITLGAGLVIYVSRRIVRPLAILEETTVRIAKGNFEPVPLTDTRDEVQQLMEAFNRMVRELDFRQEQLVQSRKLSSIGTLSSGIAHQLNNPLNNISTSAHLLAGELGQNPSELAAKMLGNIAQETLRARDIVRGLLEFSRQQEFALRPSSLREVVQRSISLISSQVPAGIRILVDMPEDIILPLDRQGMQEVFINLLMNASQAIGSPPGTVAVTAKQEPDKAVVVIQDSGPGIAPNILGQIFDPFFSTKQIGSGTGLGLYIVYGIIQKHKGAIRAENSDHGARFVIELPAGEDARESAQ